MMRNYVEVSSDGRIVCAGFSEIPDGAPLPEGVARRVFLDAPPPEHRTHYWDGQRFHPMGEPPSHAHRFNFKSKTWALDLTLALEMVRQRRDELLAASDWITLRSHERGTPVPQQWLDYRQALRDIPATVTDEQSMMAMAWPQAPTA